MDRIRTLYLDSAYAEETNNGFQYLGDAESFSVARNAKVATWTYSLKMD